MSAPSTKYTSMRDVFPDCFPYNHQVSNTIWGYLDVVTLGTLYGVDKVFQLLLKQENDRLAENRKNGIFRQFCLINRGGITAHMIKPFRDGSGYVVGVTISRKPEEESHEIWLLNRDFEPTKRVAAPEKPECIWIRRDDFFISLGTGCSAPCTTWNWKAEPVARTTRDKLESDVACVWDNNPHPRYLPNGSFWEKSQSQEKIVLFHNYEAVVAYTYPSSHKRFLPAVDGTALVFGGDQTGKATVVDFRATKNEVSGAALFQILDDGTLEDASGNRILPPKRSI